MQNKITCRPLLLLVVVFIFSVGSFKAHAQYTLIPDPNFEIALYFSGLDDTPVDGQVPTALISGVTWLNVSNYNISDLTGIDEFVSLETLDISNNNLTFLAINLHNLQFLNCSSNSISFLSTFGTPNLTTLNCDSNNLTSLDVSPLVNLEALSCSANSLNGLDLTGLSNLENLSCLNNSLYTLTTTGLTGLVTLDCSANNLTSLSFPDSPLLDYLVCANNNISSLTVAGLTNLNLLSCSSNNLSSLNLSGLSSINTLIISSNPLPSIDVSGLTSMTQLQCQSNLFPTLNLSGLTNLQVLSCTSSPVLECIQVDNVATATANPTWYKDAGASYSTSCNVPVGNQLVVCDGPAVPTIFTDIFANTVDGALNYRFRIATAAAPTTYYYVTSATPNFKLVDVVGLPLTFGTTYNVEVQSDVEIEGAPQALAYGPVCTVSTLPSNPYTRSVNQCEVTLSAPNDRIFVNGVAGASYVYRIAKKPVGYPAVQPSDFAYIYSPFSNFRLTYTPMSGIVPLEYATDYLVSVSITVAGTSSNFGSPCIISTPAFPVAQLQEAQCGSDSTPYRVANNRTYLYTYFVSGASYRFKLEQEVGGSVVYSETKSNVINWITLNSFTGLVPGTDYKMYVALDLYGEGPFGAACTITTPGIARIAAPEEDTFSAIVYPNPSTKYFMINIKSANQSLVNIKSYDMLGRLIEQRSAKVDDLENTPMGENYPTGIYNFVITQGKDVKTLRLIKR